MRASILVPFLCLGALSCAVACSGETGDTGPRGPQGGAGPVGGPGGAGPVGESGDDGIDGLSVLVSTSPEAAGAHCANGGQRLDLGLDRDGNEELDQNEIDATTYLCHGAAGENGAPGQNGENGAPGQNGEPGDDGEPGSPGQNGEPGENGQPGTPGSNGEDGDDGLSAAVRVRTLFPGAECEYGGRVVEVGIDANRNSVLDTTEVAPGASIVSCNASATWFTLPSLPQVTTVYSFALARNDVDGTARLGFNFTDTAYRTEIMNVLWDGGGPFSGAQVYATYDLDLSGAEPEWRPYEGRLTPQYYRYSELVFDAGVSHYTTNYASFGGLIAAIRGGGAGTYALTPAFTGSRAHSIAFLDGQLFGLVAQSSGLTLSTYPVAQFGVTFPNHWSTIVTLQTPASTVRSPTLIQAGSYLAGAYVNSGTASIRITSTPTTLSAGADFTEIGTCANASQVQLGFSAGWLYAGCLDTAGTLVVKRAELTVSGASAWEIVTLGVVGSVGAFDLAADGSGASLAVRQGSDVLVYDELDDTSASFDRALPGDFDLVRADEGLVLSVCDASGDKTLRTFLR